MEKIQQLKIAKEEYEEAQRAFDEVDGPNAELCMDPKHPVNQAILTLSNPIVYDSGYINLYRKNYQLTVDCINMGTLQEFNPKLISMANPAMYGHGEETKFDTEVRQAFDITADRIGDKDQWSDILKVISSSLTYQMFPNTKFSIVPYKLQIYNKGGHFKKHTDTLHGVNHVATLLIKLPMDHKGGDLNIFSSGKKIKTWRGRGDGFLDWIAFYTDLEHEVTPVTEGHRVIFQFEIYIHDQEERTESEPNSKDKKRRKVASGSQVKTGQPTPWFIQLPEACDDPLVIHECFGRNANYHEEKQVTETKVALQRHRIIVESSMNILKTKFQEDINNNTYPCIFLRHMYPVAAMEQSMFKGVDRQRADIFRSLGFRTIGIQVTVNATWGESENSDTTTVRLWDHPGETQDNIDADVKLYFVTEYCSSYNIYYHEHIAFTGNESQDGELKACSGVMVLQPILKPYLRQTQLSFH